MWLFQITQSIDKQSSNNNKKELVVDTYFSKAMVR